MPAAPAPKGDAPERPEDVKTGNSSAPEGKQTQPEPKEEPVKEPELTEDDFKQWKEEQKVPYSRFKEVNDQKKQTEQRMRELETRIEEKLRLERENAEARALAKYQAQNQSQPKEDDDLDDYLDEAAARRIRSLENKLSELGGLINEQKQTISDLTSKSEQQMLDSRLAQLKETYPEADEMAVLGWAKAKGAGLSDLEGLMEESHRMNNERVEKKFQDMIQRKKKAAEEKARVPSGRSRINLSPEEKPKTIKEAGKATRRWFAGR